MPALIYPPPEIGTKFGNLTVIGPPIAKNRKRYIPVRCACGRTATPSLYALAGKVEKNRSSLQTACSRCNLGGQKKVSTLKKRFGDRDCYSITSKVWTRSKAFARERGVDHDFLDDLEGFRQAIGPYPDDGQTYKLERINRSLGFVEGNLKWKAYANPIDILQNKVDLLMSRNPFITSIEVMKILRSSRKTASRKMHTFRKRMQNAE